MDFYKSEVDLVQKYLAWLQIFCVAAITVVFSARNAVVELNLLTVKIILLIGFFIVAATNLCVIYLAQIKVYKSADCIQRYLKVNEENIPVEFRDLIGQYKAVQPYMMCAIPAVFDIAVIIIIFKFM